MIGNSTSVLLGGGVKVMTTSGRGFNPEEIAERALDKIIAVGSDSHPAVRAQAEAFKKDIRKVLVQYMKEMVRSHNTTLANRFREMGYPELIKLLEE
jgi:acyl carrier protein phosphodiesterase